MTGGGRSLQPGPKLPGAREGSTGRASAAGGEKRKVSLKGAWSESKELITKYKGRLAIGMILMLVSRLAGLVLPASSKYLIDNVIVKQQYGLLLPLAAGRWTPMIAFGLLLAAWIATTAAENLRGRLGNFSGGWRAKLRAQPRGYYGMLAAHCGVAVFIVGVTMVKGYEIERDVRMAPGDTVTVGAYTFRFDGVTSATGPNYRAARGAHAIALLTDWRQYKDLDYAKIYAEMQKPAFVFDGRNLLDAERLHALGFNVYSIGRPDLSRL